MERKSKILWALILGVLIFSTCSASQYKLGPGDKLQISVWGHDDLRIETTVRPDGAISFPLIGDYKVTGLTPKELTASLEKALATYIKNPVVTVSLVEERRIQVQVLGEVAKPGQYKLVASSKVSHAIGAAGGLNLARASGIAELIRGGKTIPLVVTKLGQAEDLPLEDGDLINVLTKPQVTLLGEVARPGLFLVDQGTGLSELIALAGGFTNHADRERAHLVRRGSTIPLALEQLGQESIPLEDGDLIKILSKPQVTLLGEVTKPGVYLIDQGTRLSELIALAGGLTELADREQAQLIRYGKATPLSNQHFTGEVKIELEDKDTIFLPPMPQVVVRGEVAKPGTYRVPLGTSIYTVLALAGDLTSFADEEQLVLTRGGEEQIVSLKAGAGELKLAAGDRLEIPRARREVLVLGQVRNPGAYPLPKDCTVLDAIALAGGTTEKANTAQIQIYAKGDLNAQQVLALGQEQLLFEGELSANPSLGEGDIVFVPESKRIDWVKVGTILGIFRVLQEIFISGK